MKKAKSFLLSASMLICMTTSVLAEEGHGGSSEVYTNVPDRDIAWQLVIPLGQDISYMTTDYTLKTAYFDRIYGLPASQCINIYISHTGTMISGNNSIPFTLVDTGTSDQNDPTPITANTPFEYAHFMNDTADTYANGEMSDKDLSKDVIHMRITKDAWQAAAPGNYSTIITYSSEIKFN